MPGANVVATNEGTGVSRETVSDSGGEFVLTALQCGEINQLAAACLRLCFCFEQREEHGGIV